jgi:hypothetical protein
MSEIILNFKGAEHNEEMRSFKMRSENNDTIETVKVRLQDQEGYDPRLIELYYVSDRAHGGGQNKMEDGKLISVYSWRALNGEAEDPNLIIIKEKELTLHFKIPNSKIRDGIQLHLRGVSPHDTIGTVKDKLQDSEGYNPENIVLRNPNTGEVLSDEKTVVESSGAMTMPNPIEISFKRDGHRTSASQTGGRRRRSRSRGSKKRRTRRTRRTRARRTRARRTRRTRRR